MREKRLNRWIAGLVSSLALRVGAADAQQTQSLDDCRRLALENNAKMKNARLEVEGAKEE